MTRHKRRHKRSHGHPLHPGLAPDVLTLSCLWIQLGQDERVTEHYSRTSMARTSLGPQKIVRDMGSSSHCGLIIVPGQEANSDNLGNFSSIFYTIIVC